MGRVRFEDRPNLRIRLVVPGRRELGAMIDAWLADPYGQALAATADPLGDYVEPDSRSAPSTPGENANAKNTFIAPILAGGFDLTDALMRGAGQDPYSAKKLAFMDATREERAQIARRRQAVDLTDAVANLRGTLERIWRRGDLDAAARRRILFELWDECAERGTPDELAAAEAARQTIVGFIRRRLPRGSAGAYSEAELRALNARRESKRVFAPYAVDAAR